MRSGSLGSGARASIILPMSSWSWIRSMKIGRWTFNNKSCLYSWSSAWSRSTTRSRLASALFALQSRLERIEPTGQLLA